MMGSIPDYPVFAPHGRDPKGSDPLEGAKPAWQEIDELFLKHGQLPPPWRLRDALVTHLLAYRAARS